MKDKMNFNMEVKSIGEDGFFSGYASVFDFVDNQNDVVMRGAFSRTLDEGEYGRQVKLLWQHDPANPIGFLSKVIEDKRGLYVEGFILLDLQKGREAYALLKSGAISGLSIGYNVRVSNYDNSSGVRMINDLDLYEISLVTFPANQMAQVVAVKSDFADETDFDCYPGHVIDFSEAIDHAISALNS